jgi:hypothetical protein
MIPVFSWKKLWICQQVKQGQPRAQGRNRSPKIMPPSNFRLCWRRCLYGSLAWKRTAYCTVIHVVDHSLPRHLLKAMREKNINPHLAKIVVGGLGLGQFKYFRHRASYSPFGIVCEQVHGFPQVHSGEMAQTVGLFLLDQPSRSKSRPDASMKWLRLQHQTFGRATNFVALVLGTMNLALQLQCTKLTWMVGHILDHGICPNASNRIQIGRPAWGEGQDQPGIP